MNHKFVFLNFSQVIKEKFLHQIRPMDVLICLIVIVSSIITIRESIYIAAKSDKIQVSVDGTEYMYPLSKDATYIFTGPLGNTVVQVQNQKVRIIESPCPNKTCMKAGSGRTLVCLPNKVIVTVIHQKEEFDAIIE